MEIAARSRLNILISGGTGSGKTTLLNAVSQHIDRDERVITVEDAVELRLQQPHVVQMETRPPNIEGVGQVAQRELVRNALRMRPDRIIVGEVRGAEAFDMLQAMNTGHDGSMSTVHANSPRDALYRVENMVMMANLNLPLRAIRMQIASAVNLIVHIERMRDGIRRVQSVVEIAGMEGEIITTRELFSFQYRGERLDGGIEGSFESTRMRPDFIVPRGTLRPRKRPPRRAWHWGDLNCSIQFSSPPLLTTVLLGGALVRVLRSERRRADLEPILSAHRQGCIQRRWARLLLAETGPQRSALPTLLSSRLDLAFAATGNRIGPPHLVAAGIAAAAVIGLRLGRSVGSSHARDRSRRRGGGRCSGAAAPVCTEPIPAAIPRDISGRARSDRPRRQVRSTGARGDRTA